MKLLESIIAENDMLDSKSKKKDKVIKNSCGLYAHKIESD